MDSFIAQYGYLAIFVLMLAESACIPIPSEVIMMLGGALAAGAVPGAHPALIGVVIAGVAGNVAGSYIAWAVGRYAGLPVIHRWGRLIGIREHEIERATAWFDRRGPIAVLVGRIVPVIRTFISLPAGIAEMPAGRFGLYTTLGCIPWTAALGIAGYALGANWQQVANDFHGPTYAIAGILLVAAVVGIIMYRRRQKATRLNGNGDGTASTRPGMPGQAQQHESGQYAAQPPRDWQSVGQPPVPTTDPWGAGNPDPANRQWGPPSGQGGQQGW